ncbi:transcriptional activator RfaH [Pseudomonas syringae]|nr:transcriptional activator RfaH [Pseudomonas syringae]UQB25911.1 transcriptional activator RfaH [Pseudomonas syringae]
MDGEFSGSYSEKPEGLPLEKKAKKEWYLVQCKSGQDSRAEENLTAQGYTNFRPIINNSNHSGTNFKHPQSLFPGYLFIHLSTADNWEPIRSTKGVLTVVKFGGRAHAVKNEIIQDIKNRARFLNSLKPVNPENEKAVSGYSSSEITTVLSAKSHEERTLLLVSFLHSESLKK